MNFTNFTPFKKEIRTLIYKIGSFTFFFDDELINFFHSDMRLILLPYQHQTRHVIVFKFLIYLKIEQAILI